jgi:hypothetical protein
MKRLPRAVEGSKPRALQFVFPILFFPYYLTWREEV